MFPGAEQFLEDLCPIFHRLVVHPDDNIFDDRRADSFVGNGEMNVGRIACLVFEDGPYSRAHLLALHPSRVTGNAKSQESDKCCNDCVVSTSATKLFLLRHPDYGIDAEIVGQARLSRRSLAAAGRRRIACDHLIRLFDWQTERLPYKRRRPILYAFYRGRSLLKTRASRSCNIKRYAVGVATRESSTEMQTAPMTAIASGRSMSAPEPMP